MIVVNGIEYRDYQDFIWTDEHTARLRMKPVEESMVKIIVNRGEYEYIVRTLDHHGYRGGYDCSVSATCLHIEDLFCAYGFLTEC